ncbi:hypothetical protein REH65_32595 [Saccharopolyspora sp. ID03-671]|uniref:hypothetical protein n=1 Tax=Saccharopolyspora sp. ID03-671 TaxID=3073066 RepID=UPI00325048C2
MVMLRTEVTIGAQTWLFVTARIGTDAVTGKDEHETAVIEPGARVPKPVRRCLTQERAYQAHHTLVDDLAATAHGYAEIRSYP